MFNKKKIHETIIRLMEQLDIKLPVTMELKVRVNFFGSKIRAFSEAKA